MSYASDVKCHITFDSEPFLEAKSGNFFTSNGETPTIVNAKIDTGWQMSDKTYLTIDTAVSVSTGLTIGFWLKPTNPGMITDDSGETVSLKMPVLSKANYTGTDTISASSWTFILWEETQSDGTNIMKVAIRGLISAVVVSCILVSSPYEVDNFHHFWITYEGGVTPSFKLYIDAVEDYSATIVGSIPTQLSLNGSKLSINNKLEGDANLIARNNGIIDDLVIFSSAHNDSSEIATAANRGSAYIAVTEQLGSVELDQAVIFDDPGQTQISGVFANRGKVFIAKNNGTLLQGEKKIWQARKDFSKSTEIEKSSLTKKSDVAYAVNENGSIKIVDTVVRI